MITLSQFQTMATVNPLLVSGSAVLFGAGVITKAAHKRIRHALPVPQDEQEENNPSLHN